MSKKVLVIESEPWLGEHFEDLLKRHEFEVVTTSNAYSAVDMIDEEHPDVIVMGLMLSGASGLGLLHELQSYVDTAKLPVIVCGSAVGLSLEELQPYGVRRLLDTSTMRPDDLAAAVRSVLI
jgi:DNA-binding NarL/FixJ family response regulator